MQVRIENRGKPVSNFPIGAMGTFEVSGADGTYSILVDEAAPIKKDENRIGHVNKVFSHRGVGNF